MRAVERPLILDHEILELLPEQADLFAIADALAATQAIRRRRASKSAVVLIAAALVALLGALLIAAPWRGGPSFVQQALAAVGKGRYVHVVLDDSTPSSEIIDLASGRSRPSIQTTESVYDTRTGAVASRFSSNGAVFAPSQGASVSPGPLLTNFALGYRRALEDGKARIVGETSVDSQEAKILRFPFALRDRDGKVAMTVYEDVAVAADSFAPLWIRSAWTIHPHTNLPESYIYAPPCPCTRVLSIRSSDERPVLPTPRKWPRPVDGDVTDIRPVELLDTSAALRHPTLWPGGEVGETILQTITLQRVTTRLISGAVQNWPKLGSKRGLRLEYRGEWRSLVIEEAATPQAGYGFGSAVWPLPPLGQASLFCQLCQTPRDTPGLLGDPPRVWAAQLHKDGLFIRIRSTSRSLVVRAARALRPMP